MVGRINKHLLEALLSILVILTKDCLSLKSLFIKVPEIVKSGDTVALSCEYDLEQAALYTIKWYKNNEEFFRFVPKESPPFRAFPLPHVNVDISASGPTKVTLNDVSKEMTGDYNCEVSADAPLFHTEIRGAHMIVAELPTEMPTLTIDPKKIEIGKKLTAECRSPVSYPAAKLTWYINEDRIFEDNNDLKIVTTHSASNDRNLDLQSTKSKIEIVANQTFFALGQMVLKCEASIQLLWIGVVHTYIRDETPLLAPVLGSTSSHSVDDSTFDMFNRNGCAFGSLSMCYVVLIALIHLLVAIR